MKNTSNLHVPNTMKRQTRSATGAAQLTEFGAATVMLITFIVLPLINIAIIPVRFAMGKSIVSTQARNLSKSETFSEALARNNNESSRWAALQAVGGITVKNSQLSLTVQSTKGATPQSFSAPRTIPSNLLPTKGRECPYLYVLDQKVSVDIYPLVAVSWPQARIPGLTGPLSIQFHEVSVWENLSRDPVTGEFFINQ
ncbi:MAG: hypothetical protein K2Z81_25835 [Cyanobacteria bacterium]|nr:hypothetical protein [Cyanobacteriota bacterium]